MATVAKCDEKAEGDLPAGEGVYTIVKLACLLLIGVVVINGVATTAIAPNGTFYSLYLSVRRSITYGYSIAGRVLITLAAAVAMRYLDLI